jgi:RNA polymerase sigma-54 factor
MRLSHQQGQGQSQSPLTSAHIAQTMTLLSMTTTELLQTIDLELSKNPALELINERRCPMCGRKLPPTGPCPVCSQPRTLDPEETIVFVSPRDDFYSYSGRGGFDGDNTPEDPYASINIDLPSYVMHQVAPDLEREEQKIAAMILSNLDEDGFLAIEIRDICRFHHTTSSSVERVLTKIRHCEPLGVGARSIEEALLAQVDVLAESTEVPNQIREAIAEHFDLLSKHHFGEIAKKLRVTNQEAKSLCHFISENLNPFPARSNWGNFRQPNDSSPDVFHQPDILIYYLNNNPKNPLIIEIITPSRGTLRINPLFQKALTKSADEKKEEWKKDLDKASLLIKCIQQRSNTMRQLMEKLVNIQKSFIIQGDTYLEPLTRAHIAEALDVHESTISRAVANKTVQLPNKKIIPLSTFFDRSLAVRAIMRNIIENEIHALNDTEIKNRLEKQGIKIARRTVAKYRSMEGILPAHLRRIEKFATV